MAFTDEQRRNAAVKRCKTCAETLPLTEFYGNGRSGHRSECKKCRLAEKAEWYAANKDRVNAQRRARAIELGPEFKRAQDLKYRFGLTPADVELALAKQGGCAICHADEPGGKGTWHVDHDHACCPQPGRSCGECVRGILCHRCNLMLGQAGDCPDRLRGAIAYLSDWGVTDGL